ncbi:hypothetical protein F4810DRAFT_709695 [Camillea tinctor]|nr:hypothetical protein F4810DRAFT_709695 [Camillea tinctor]
MPPHREMTASRASSVGPRSPSPSQYEYYEDPQESEQEEQEEGEEEGGEEESRAAARARTQKHIQRRHAREMELPPHPNDYQLVLPITQIPRKRPAYPAYDDRLNKRTRAGQLHPQKWTNSNREQPPSPFSPPPAQNRPNPITALGAFAALPPEIRDAILRPLLLCQHAIRVFAGWTRAYPRSRPRLDLAVLRTCRALHRQGQRVLYGENTFEYDVRDPAAWDAATRRVLRDVFGRSELPFDRRGHLVRRVRVRVPADRMGFRGCAEAFARALRKFLPGGGLSGGCLHTLTLEVPALCVRDLEWRGDPEEVPICRFFREGSHVREALLRLPVQWVRVLAHDRNGKTYETVCDLRYFFKQKQEQAAMGMEGVDIGIGSQDGDGEEGEGERTGDVQAMKELWKRNVRQSKAQLYTLSWRLETLARDPDKAVDELHLWTRVPTENNDSAMAANFHTRRNPGRNDAESFVSLPPNWREVSSPAKAGVPKKKTKKTKNGNGNTGAEWLEGVTEEGGE